MDKSVFKRRIYLAGLILAVILFFFVIRLFDLHFSDKIKLPRTEPVANGRGYIYDREGRLLALSIEYDSVYVNPKELKDPPAAAGSLSAIVKIPVATLLSRFKADKKFVWLTRRCEPDVSKKIRESGIRGVHFTKEYKRLYPCNTLASNIIGFVGLDNTGLEGVEYKFDGILSGRDETGRDEISREIYLKKNITLTIDRYIQYVAEDELAKAVLLHRVVQGAVVILEVNTGRILAIAKNPSFDPNYFYNYNISSRTNFSIVDSFEPGSTMKIIALASLLEYRPEALKKEYFCPGYVDVNDIRINCLHTHGKVTMEDIIKQSCNAGMIQSVKILEKKEYYDILKKFGFGSPTGIEIPGEAEGILRPVSQWSGLSKYSMSIGHEISVTSVQLAAAFNSIANGGVYMIPSLIEKIEKQDGTPVRTFYPRTRGRIIKAEDAALLMKMMRSVVTSGTGKKAASVFYEIAGKTGTSQKFSSSAGGYSDRNVSTFVGIAPYSSPRICMLVVLDDPSDRFTGGASAAPVFMRITERVLPYLGVGGKDISSLRMKKSAAPVRSEFNLLPDLTGMTVSEVASVLKILYDRHGIKYFIKGSGRVFAQKPAPGSELKKGENLVVFMR